ncbi:hypothetical protein [Pseudactinotalea sp.]|uniref:hypothetical protein n=1 Tax=Pseudactinotalea sp. TaxID=1926260 RepID=UPI003B3A4221
MAHAAVVSAVAGEVEGVQADLQTAVPDHWTGRAAGVYQTTARNLATGLGAYAVRIRGLAALIHRHERELVAIRTALSGGGNVAV